MLLSDSPPAAAIAPRPYRPEVDVTSLALSLEALFSARPTLLEAAQRCLQGVFDERYPTLGIVAANAAILEPLWRQEQGQERFIGYRTDRLPQRLLERCRGEPAKVYAPASFVATAVGAESSPRINVALSEIEQVLDEQAPLLLEYYQQDLVDFWSQAAEGHASVWQQLSDLFRVQLQHAASTLVGDELATVKAVLDYPDSALREGALGRASPEVGITFVDSDDHPRQANEVLVLSMTREVDGRSINLIYSVQGGIEVFGSAEQLVDSWFGQARAGYARLHNYIPEHDVFDALALCLLERQLQALAALDPSSYADAFSLDLRVTQSSSLKQLLGAFHSGHEAKLKSLQALLPPWLKNATVGERGLYSRMLSALASQYRTGGSYMAGIPTISDYASARLKDTLLEDHSTRHDVVMGDIVVTLSRVANSGFDIVDEGYTQPRYEVSHAPFVQMAIQGVDAFPHGLHGVTYQGGEPPSWMTYMYLRGLVERADIGGNYPTWLQQQFFDEPLVSTRRQQQFSASQRLLLPLLALELKIRKQLSDQAYRAVAAVVHAQASERQVDGHEQVIRPLAFQTHAGAPADRVLNMFVIGPLDTAQGPQLLYRPATATPLIEFGSWAALLAAIAQEGELQDSVLDGLTSMARRIYANGGFLEPHIAHVFITDYDTFGTPTPALLSLTPLQGDPFRGLYRACAQALIKQAREASVSNAEARWGRFKAFAWAAFNLIQPLLEGPVAAVGLLVQLTASLDQWVNRDPGTSWWAGMGEVLMNLALVLMHEGLGGRYVDQQPARGAALGARRVWSDSLLQKRTTMTPEGVIARLVYEWSSPRGGFSARELVRLEDFKVSTPVARTGGVTVGEYAGLYQQGEQWYANVAQSWFRVARRLEGVVVIDEAHPARTGPWLKRDAGGRWLPDFGLRLLGGQSDGLSLRAARRLKSLLAQGKVLLGTLNKELDDCQKLPKDGYAPVDLEHIIEGRAAVFRECGETLAQSTATLGDKAPTALIERLRDAASQLKELARTTRIAMTKGRNPTVGAVEYLLQEKAISLRKLGRRRDISGNKGTDFLQEYEIRDAQGQPLWYAHFHYSSADAQAQAFTKAHLKTQAQRLQGLSFQKTEERAGRPVDPIWRGIIGTVAARSLFLSL